MKNCIHCGAELHDDASFCHLCAKSQREKRNPVLPKPKNKKLLRTLLSLALAVCVLFAISKLLPREEAPAEPTLAAQPEAASEPSAEPSPEPVNEPQIFDNGGAEMLYTHGGKSYHLAVSFSPRDSAQSCAVGEERSDPIIGADENYMTYDQLYVVSEDKSSFAHGEFDALVKEVRVRSITGTGATLELSPPESDPNNPGIYLRTAFFFNVSNHENYIHWEIEMLNGDIIRLHQIFSVKSTKSLSYSHEEYPMNTIGELQALIDSICTTVPIDTEVTVYLPPVVYEGGLTIASRSVNLTGSSDAAAGVERTTFTGTVTVNAYAPNASTFRNIAFEVSNGTGVLSRQSVSVESCVFRNCAVGALAEYNGWIRSVDCLFENNGVGIEINNSGNAALCNTDFVGHRFIGNAIAFRLSSCVYAESMNFIDCQFSGNGDDVVNVAGNTVTYTNCEME
ncbi:MAG: hypothetical protein IJY96_00825 [Oscillospiraceae bacterium]|nr:hypothetical protein [Oscillospiraceae bacterium]